MTEAEIDAIRKEIWGAELIPDFETGEGVVSYERRLVQAGFAAACQACAEACKASEWPNECDRHIAHKCAAACCRLATGQP